MRIRQRMATMIMKIKLTGICVLSIFSLIIFLCSCHTKNDDCHTKNKRDSYTSTIEDSLKKQAGVYYSDMNHWIFFVEEPTVVKIAEDSIFDKAGLKHATFQWSLNCLAIPTESDLKYMPRAIAFTKYFKKVIPVAGRNAEQLKMIRSAVFPFSSNYPTENSSSQLFQKYVDQVFYQTIDSSLFPMTEHVLCAEDMVEQVNNSNDKKKSGLTRWIESRNSWIKNGWGGKSHNDNMYIVPASSIADSLKQFMNTPEVSGYYQFGDRYAFLDMISYAEENYEGYCMLNHNTVFLYSSYAAPFIDEHTYFSPGTAITIYPHRKVEVDLQSCLKDTTYKIVAFPSHYDYVEAESYSARGGDYPYVIEIDRDEPLDKSPILSILKKNNCLYDFYTKGFYKKQDPFSFFKYSEEHWQDNDEIPKRERTWQTQTAESDL